MTDLDRAKSALPGNSLSLCKGQELITHRGRGISPMMELLAQGRDLRGFSAADLIVGKAAALLFVKAGISAVYGETMSRSGAELLEERGIPHSFGTLTEAIINRSGTGPCPMEQTVAAISDPEEAYAALQQKRREMRFGKYVYKYVFLKTGKSIFIHDLDEAEQLFASVDEADVDHLADEVCKNIIIE